MIRYHDRIRRQFGRSAGEQYDSNVRVQLIMAAELAERVQERYVGEEQRHPAPSSILEIGCGTGTLTALLARTPLLHGSSITAIDISPAMLEAARRKVKSVCPEAISRVQWIEADAERWAAERDSSDQPLIKQSIDEFECLIQHNEQWGPMCDSLRLSTDAPMPYSLIISNACFQWFVQPAHTLAALRRSLRTGGVLAFTTFGPRTMHELHGSFRHAYQQLGLPYRHHGLTFHSLSAWRDMLRGAGFQLLAASSQEHTETHRSVSDFLHAVKAIGASAVSTDTEHSSGGSGIKRRLFREMFHAYESNFPSSSGTGIAATYETLTFLAIRD